MPVFDGVMYEKKGIDRLDKFSENFSLVNRYSQAYFEFFTNPVSAFFSSIVTVVYPKWLAGNTHILVRSFLALLAFGLLLSELLPFKQAWRKVLVIGLLYGNFFFFDFRVGLGSFIPEITCTLLLLSAYMSLWLYIQRKQFKYLALTMIFITIGVGSRYNFVVFNLLVLLPLIPIVLLEFLRVVQRYRWFKIGIILGWLFLLGTYLYVHLDFFLSYYFKPVVYEETSLFLSCSFLLKNFFNGFGWSGMASLAIVFLIAAAGQDRLKRPVRNLIFAWYPFVFFLIFLLLQKRGYNVPHINTLNFVALLFAVALPIQQFRFLLEKKVTVVLCVLSGAVVFGQHYYYHRKLISYQSLDDDNLVPRMIATNLSNKLLNGEQVNYMTAFESLLEVPIDVAVYRKTKIWLGTTNQFYLNDWNLWDIDTSLNVDRISEYYKNSIIEKKISPFYIGKELPKMYRGFTTASEVHGQLYDFIAHHSAYMMTDTFHSEYHGTIYMFELISK